MKPTRATSGNWRRCKPAFLLLCLLLVSACGTDAVREPEVACDVAASATQAAPCLQGVRVDLGPADQVTAYHNLPGLVVILLPDPAAAAGIPADDDPNALSLTVDTVVQLQGLLVDSYSADEEGRLSLAIEGGAYVLCAITDSLIEPGQRTSGCRRIQLAAGAEHRLLIRHNPWGDFLAFDWQTP